MEKANFGQIVSFLFGIANDCLVDTYDVGDYRKIILPMMVIRRFDAVLEPTKEKVLKMKEQLDAAGITDQDEALCSVAGEAFCNSVQANKDVAIAIINQFPAYVESSRNMIEQYNAMCDKVLQSNDDSRKDAVMAYKTILDDLSILLKQNGITPEQQEKITDKMILVADKIADLHEDNRNFLEGIIKYGTPLIGGALLLGAVILGVNVKGTKLPTINGKK